MQGTSMYPVLPIAYWRSRGLDIRFVPYRVYEIAGGHYFEVFSPPDDRHFNPKSSKGLMLNTDWRGNPDRLWRMFKRSTIEVDRRDRKAIDWLSPGDIVSAVAHERGLPRHAHADCPAAFQKSATSSDGLR